MQPVDQPFPGLSGLRVIVTGGTRGIGAGIAQGFLRTGGQVMVCARNEPAALPAVDDRTASFTRADVRDPDQARRLIEAGRGAVRRRRRGDQQRGRLPARRGRHRVAAVSRQGHRAEPDRTAARGAGRQRGDAGTAGRRLDHHDRQRERHPPVAGHRGLRRRQGRPAPSGHQPGHRVGAQGTGEYRRPRLRDDRRRPPALRRRRRCGRHRRRRPAGPDGHPGGRGRCLPVPRLARRPPTSAAPA